MTAVGNTGLLGVATQDIDVAIPFIRVNDIELTNFWKISFKAIESRLVYKAMQLDNTSRIDIYSKDSSVANIDIEVQDLAILNKVFAGMGNPSLAKDIHEMNRRRRS